MSTNGPNLKGFIEPVATVPDTCQLAAVLETFSLAGDRIVVVDESGHPTGIIYLSSFTAYILQSLNTPPQAPVDSHKKIRANPKVRLDLQQPLYATGPPIIQPLNSLKVDLSLNELWPLIETQEAVKNNGHTSEATGFVAGENQPQQLEWALVDAGGKFLGLLNRGQLLQFLATEWQKNQANSTGIQKSSQRSSRKQPTSKGHSHQNPAPPSPLPSLTVGQLEGATNPRQYLENLYPLIELLDRLPLPLSLQTSSGETIARNQAWSRHIPEGAGHRPYPENQPQGEAKPPQKGAFFEAQPRGSQSAETDPSFADTPSEERHWPPGSDPFADTYWGVCSIPSGQEKVWQFVKMPLDILWPESNSNPKTATTPLRQRAAIGTESSRSTGPTPLEVITQTLNLPPTAPSFNGNGERPPAIPEVGDNSQSDTLWLVLAQDVTEHQQVAKELAAKNADLVQLNRLKDEFLACISHELKTPLTAVLGLSSLLKDQTIGQLNERQARYARLIYQSGRHLMAVVNDILDLTRMESGQMELILEPISIQAVCERAFKTAWQLKPSSDHGEDNDSRHSPTDYTTDSGHDPFANTNFSLEIEPGLDIIIADELRLRQMIVNLLSNAFKFTEPTGSTGLKVTRWESWIAFTVWDTGIGIPDDKQHLIFQKFQQLESPLTRQFEGVGLGLVVARGLARLHGGDVTFISKEGKGSQFTLLLPPCPPEPSTTPTSPPAAPPHRLVLIVEAVPRFIEQLSEQLTSLGYRIVIARSGTEALDKARRFYPEVVFLNPLLPLLSGWDVLTLLKSDSVTRNIPVIVTATGAERDQAYQNRADGFLSLPVQLVALRQTLCKLQQQDRETAKKLTVLRLNASSHQFPTTSELIPEGHPAIAINNSQTEILGNEALNYLLHRHHYRVLEADDLEQAELLARVWQPDVVLVQGNGTFVDTLAYLKQLADNCSRLGSLPLVTLDRTTTQAAHQISSLSVFPCTIKDAQPTVDPDTASSALLQVIQLAAGRNFKPHILVVDLSNLPDLSASSGSVSFLETDSRNDWRQLLIQYVQTAGFRGSLGRSWVEVLDQLQHQSIDLLLIGWRDPKPNPSIIKALADFQEIPAKPPVLVWTHRREGDFSDSMADPSRISDASVTQPSQGSQLLKDIATEILPPSLSVAELLSRIKKYLRPSAG